MSDWRSWGYFPKSRPRAAKGGIRAQSQRGGFGQTWWAKRWIAVLESFQFGSRLSRGRSYARQGQVLSVNIETGSVSAAVQGSRPSLYRVVIQVKGLTKAEWRKVADVVSSQAIFGAKLLAGEMPQDIEAAFQSASVSLFPARLNDLKTECSCPDSSNPCKHVAAVYYLLGEEFDRDPFLIFQLRGMSREDFLGLMAEAAPSAPKQVEDTPADPLPTDPRLFWSGGELPPDLLGEVDRKPAGAALAKRLGKFPFWRGSENFLEAMERMYAAAAARTLRMLSG